MQQSAPFPLWLPAAAMLAAGAMFLLGVQFARHGPYPQPEATAMQLVFEEIRDSYVEPQDESDLMERAIGAMARLDTYSQYVPPGEVGTFVEATTGTYEGIGVLTHRRGERLFVHFPLAGGPSERAGIRPGDEILAVDGTRLANLTPDQRGSVLAERVRGPAGTEVALTLGRPDGEEIAIVVERAPVHKPAVRWAQLLDADQGLGYVHVADFYPGVTEELRAALDKLEARPGGLRGLIVDLRFDGGGSLDECVAMARLFLPQGRIVTVRRRTSELTFDATPNDCRYPALPLVVLVNGTTASASEVLCGALQDHGRAAVVGSRTYGKGVVQTVYKWKELDFRLKLTTARYYTPNGRNLGALRKDADDRTPQGLEPDHAVEIDEALLRRLYDELGEYEVPEQYVDEVAAFARENEIDMPGILPPDQDPQLQKAIEVLQARVAGGDREPEPARGK